MNHRGLINWPEIHVGYEENQISVRALARMYHISDTAIHKRATAEKWGPRKPAPDQLRHGSPSASVTRAMSAARQLREGTDGLQSSSPPERATLTLAQLVRRMRGVIEDLLRELAETTKHIGEIEDEIINETSRDGDGRRRQAMLRAISLPSRSLVAKNLAQAIRGLSHRTAPKPLGKKEQGQRNAEFLAKNSMFSQRRRSRQYRKETD